MNTETTHGNDDDLVRSGFIEEVIASEVVWLLANEDGVANSASVDDESTAVLMFWSQHSLVQRVKHNGFEGYTADKLSLSDFLYRWLPGMDEDAVLAGVNWSKDLVGTESDPDDLREDIEAQMPTELLAEYAQALEDEESDDA